MSKDKYPSIFSRQMEAIVLIILHVIFKKRVRVFHRGFQTRENYYFRVFGHSDETRSFSNMHHEPRTMKKCLTDLGT